MKNDEIYKLMETQGQNFDLKLENLNLTIEGGLKGMGKYVDAGFETMRLQDELRNGRIGSNTDEIEIVKCETSFWRWSQVHWKFTLPAAIIVVAALILVVPRINIKQFVKNNTGIEIIE